MSKKKETPPSKNPLTPEPVLLMKLGSALVHADEFLSPDGHPFDKDSFERMLQDPDVQEWIKGMGAMLPQKRR